MASHIGRRQFLATLGAAAAAWPLAARAQQPAVPVIGYLNSASPEADAARLTGLRRGLNQSGYVEGRNLVIEYRWAGNQADRLPALAADLIQLRVAVIVTHGLRNTKSLIVLIIMHIVCVRVALRVTAQPMNCTSSASNCSSKNAPATSATASANASIVFMVRREASARLLLLLLAMHRLLQRAIPKGRVLLCLACLGPLLLSHRTSCGGVLWYG
jgi:hypothetical protein